jgi:hypothetical protein
VLVGALWRVTQSGGAWRAACIDGPEARNPGGPSVGLISGALPGGCLAAGGLQRGAVLGDQAVLLELADVAIQIGGVDAEFGGDLLDGEPWTVLDQAQDILLTARLAVAAHPAFVGR